MLLEDFHDRKAKALKRKIKDHYRSHNVKIKIPNYQVVPHLQRYIFNIKPSMGTQVKNIFDRARDIQSSLQLPLFYPYKEGISIHLAVSEYDLKENMLLKILRNPLFINSDMQIPLALGYDLLGKMHIVDLVKLHHLLIVGPSGTGKSVALRCIVLSIIVRCSLDTARLLLFDIGGNSLSIFQSVLHLYHPIVKDVKTGIRVLESLVVEMEKRIDLGEDECQLLSFIVCIIDEFDDTISSINDINDSKRFVDAMNSLIRKGRKAKIIMILASHDPTLKNTRIDVNLIISRIVFQLVKSHNSTTALGVSGANKLSGGGSLIFRYQEEIKSLQGSNVTSAEIERVLSNAPADYDNDDKLVIVEQETESVEVISDFTVNNEHSKELAKIVFWALGQRNVSALQIREKYSMSNRVKTVMEELCRMGIVTELFKKQPRRVLPTEIEDLTPETINLLERYGFTSDAIRETLDAKKEKQ